MSQWTGWIKGLLVCMLAVSVSVAQPILAIAEEKQVHRVALVIDDFGNDMLGTDDMLSLSIPFAAAVMPFLPSTKQDAERAHQLGKEVIVHLPMEPRKGKASWLGPGAIVTSLSDEEIRKRVIAAVEEVPFAIGINNHMGSRATADERVVRIILNVCRERNLFFLDSRTTDKSVVAKLAKEIGVRTAENHLFLDDVYTRSHVSKQAVKLKKLVQKQPDTIVIGHVGPPGKITAEVVKETIPLLEAQGTRFVPLSEMMEPHGLPQL